MEAHEHPDLLDDQIEADTALEIEPSYLLDVTGGQCSKCRSTHVYVVTGGFWSLYCGFCGAYS